MGRRAGGRFNAHQQYHRHPLPLAGQPQHSAGAGLLRLCLRHLYRNGQTAVRLSGSGAGAAGRPALRVQRQRLRRAEVGHQPETAGGAADVRWRLYPVGPDDQL